MWHSFLLTLPGFPPMRWHLCSTAKVGVALAQRGALHPPWKPRPSPSVCQLPSVTVCRGPSVTCRTPTNGAKGSQLASLFFIPDLDCLPPPRAPAFPREPCLSPSPSSPNQQHLPSACHLRHVGPSGGAGYSTRLVTVHLPLTTPFLLTDGSSRHQLPPPRASPHPHTHSAAFRDPLARTPGRLPEAQRWLSEERAPSESLPPVVHFEPLKTQTKFGKVSELSIKGERAV